jgi:hypothetical protein
MTDEIAIPTDCRRPSFAISSGETGCKDGDSERALANVHAVLKPLK